MTYRELLAWINTLSPEQLDSPVTVFQDEVGYQPITGVDFSVGSRLVEDNRPILYY